MEKDFVGKRAVSMLKESLYGSDKDKWDDDYVPGIFEIDGIPEGKRSSLKEFYDKLLMNSELTKEPLAKNNYFRNGDTVLSCCIHSLYENVITVLEKYRGIDVMGEFYTTFLRFTKGNAKEKGIVLTPKHITDLFCDIAEYYGGQKLSEQAKILDPCCGTGGFLISALERINDNIKASSVSSDIKKEKCRKAQQNSLIGVEKDPSMYALAYANMRFHGDGKSNLFNCSSLMSDSYLAEDGRGYTFVSDDEKISLTDALASFGDIDIGMINPPYSLGSTGSVSGEYEIVKKIKQAKDDIKKTKKMKTSSDEDKEKKEALLAEQTAALDALRKEIDESRMDEVVLQKGQSELDFIASMLHYLKVGGIGIAIVPMSCGGTASTTMRSEILKHHTLLASMSMPPQLFTDSNVGTTTCILVFKAHVPHDENKSVFFARWQNDGFKVIPHNGRKPTEAWESIHEEWLDQMDGSAQPNEKVWARHKIGIKDEALAEAYVKTDYSTLNDKDFESVLKKYALFKYMNENGMIEV